MHQVIGTTTARARALDIERVDRAVEDAIRAGRPGSLQVLGYGEITLVFGWPGERPEFAVKRLPPFRDRAQLDRYADLLERYTAALHSRGVRMLPTELLATTAGGGPRAYLVQPLVPRTRQLGVLLREAAPERGAALLDGLAEHVAVVVDGRLGLDAQASNWAVEDGRLVCFDLSTPLMRSPDGRHELDLSLFLSIYPWALRAALVPVAHGVMAQYHDARTVLLDVASNLVKERLDRWLPALLGAARARVSPPIEEGEVRRYFARDKKLWLLMQRLRRADRAWQRRVRRRPYPFLLPPPYHYGPPELPESEAP
ncbi:MAG TPA: DUF6206 family protein [Thermoleophilaceae bacterium]|nr:DUF6206 family protein [Thermoleophilaceae bacterium]